MSLILEAISRVNKDIEFIQKGRENLLQKFRFRGIDDVYNVIHNLLAKYEIVTMFEIEGERTEERLTKNDQFLIFRIVKVKYIFYATDGSSISTTVIGEGMDCGDKACGKALSMAHKYALIQIFTIPTEDPEQNYANKNIDIKRVKNQDDKYPEIVTEFYNLVGKENWSQFKKKISLLYPKEKSTTNILDSHGEIIKSHIDSPEKLKSFLTRN